MTKLNDFQKKFILTMADCSMNQTEVGRELFIVPSTASFHCRQIKNLTGKDPRKFWDLLELLKMIGKADCHSPAGSITIASNTLTPEMFREFWEDPNPSKPLEPLAVGTIRCCEKCKGEKVC